MSVPDIMSEPVPFADERLVNIYNELVSSHPLRPENTLVQTFTILMEHPTLPNLDQTGIIMRELTEESPGNQDLSEFAGVTRDIRIALIYVIKEKLPVLLEHLPPKDKFEFREVDGEWIFEILPRKESMSLEDQIKVTLNFQLTTCLQMCNRDRKSVV